MSGGDASQNGAPPPPPPPSGSPFGRFLTQPVFLVALVALMISLPLVALAVNGGGDNAGGPPPDDEPAVVGSWAGATTGVVGGQVAIQLDVRSLGGGDDGTLTRRYEAVTCSGTLRYRDTTARGVTFDYVERLHPRRCPRRSTIVLRPLAGDRLRFEERRRGRIVADGELTAR